MIDLIFGFINFFIVVGILVYGIKYYFLPWLVQAIKHEHDERERFVSTMHAMDRTHESLEAQLIVEQERYRRVSEKFAWWREKKHNEQLVQHDVYVENIQKAKERRIAQQNNFSELMVLNAIKSKALKDARARLEEYFKNDAHGKHYKQLVLKSMKDSS